MLRRDYKHAGGHAAFNSVFCVRKCATKGRAIWQKITLYHAKIL